MIWTDLSSEYKSAFHKVASGEEVNPYEKVCDELVDYGFFTYNRHGVGYELTEEGKVLYSGKEEAEAEEIKKAKGAWIILTAKLPTNPSPPKLSIHWATPWPLDREKIETQIRQQIHHGNEDMDDEYFFTDWGKEPNVKLPVRIHYKGNDIRVWKHEFNYLTPDRMRDYVAGGEEGGNGTHLLMEGTKSDQALLRAAMDTDLRGIYDAALIDGCNPEMAKLLAMGMEFNDDTLEFPPVCWYKLHPELIHYYMDDSEAEE